MIRFLLLGRWRNRDNYAKLLPIDLLSVRKDNEVVSAGVLHL